MDTVPTRPNPWRDSPWSGVVRARPPPRPGKLGHEERPRRPVRAWPWPSARPASAWPATSSASRSSTRSSAGGGGTLAGRLRGDNADACAIAEGTNHEVVRATRGGHRLRRGLPGRRSHGLLLQGRGREPRASPWAGSSAGSTAGCSDARRWSAARPTRDFPDPAPVQVLALESNRCDPDVPWSVPLEARVRAYFQFLPHEDVPRSCARSRRRSRAFCRRRPLLPRPSRCASSASSILPSSVTSSRPTTPGRAAFTGRPRGVLGNEARLSASEWPCDAFLAQRYFKIPTLLFGPRGAGSHNANEYVEVPSVLRTAEVYLAAALEWCGGRG